MTAKSEVPAIVGAPYTREVTPPDPRQRFARQVVDAAALLEHATSKGKVLEDRVTVPIVEAQRLLAGGDPPPVHAWAQFTRAYSELSQAMGGVTANTLRATSDYDGEERGMWTRTLFTTPRISDARRWTYSLWRITILAALVALVAQFSEDALARFYALDENSEGLAIGVHLANMAVQLIAPFAFGALGAAAYLLRSAHGHIHERTFDPNFIPEYNNRLFLGVIAGGAIQHLIDTVTQDGAIIDLSAAAVAFIAGYNADLLFKTVERISEALLPKVGVTSMKRAQPNVDGVNLTTLLDQAANTSDPETKAAILAVIAKLRERL